MKETAEEISLSLKIIFSTSLRTKIVLADWKDGEITALFKKGNKVEPSNSRPVSLTSIVSKIMEKIITDALIEHTKINKYLSKSQYGFIQGRSTTLHLLTVPERWTEVIDDGNEVHCIYLDLMKAFDKVPHKRLLSKLKSYNVNDQIFSWIESFLKGRRQRMVVNGERSTWRDVSSGNGTWNHTFRYL